jgi:suppressor for copper-sensitivity B
MLNGMEGGARMLKRSSVKGFSVIRLSKLAGATALVALLSAIGLFGPAAGRASAQSGELDASGGLLGGGSDESDGDLPVHASILPPAGDRPAQLSIEVDVPSGWHIYSITQPPGGPNRTSISLDPSNEYLRGNYMVDPAPYVHLDDAFPGVPQEEQTGHVTWTAPLTLRQGIDLSRLHISGSVTAQRCATAGRCLPPKPFKFTATLVGSPVLGATTVPVPPATQQSVAPVEQAKWVVGQYQADRSDALLRGWVDSSVVSPGSTARLVLSIAPGPGSHVYASAPRDPNAAGNGKPTLIALNDIPHWKIDAPQPDRPATEETTTFGVENVYTEPVRWTVDIHVPSDAVGNFPLEGIIGYQTCTAKNCTLPTAARFAGTLTVTPDGSNQAKQPVPLWFLPAGYSVVAKLLGPSPGGAANSALGGSQSAPDVASVSAFLRELHPRIKGTEPTSLVAVIFFGLVGGLILNLMPCVLPVIGLKILGFVEQGGQSRARTLVLNVWYSLGLLLVFMVLATLAVKLQLKWGQQFQSPAFVIVMCGVVFVMALSLLGIWEIPIPGFIGSGKSVKLAAKEGTVGAFAKGVLTTVLATPCSGPYLGAVFSYALTQSPLVTYIVFASIGLGMASPYLLIGAFPALVRFLPKPGMWMETFKQIMGFVLLGTVVYLFSLLDKNLYLRVLTLLVGLWAGCWWIGRTPLTANLGRKLTAWTGGAVIAGTVGYFAFTVLAPHPALLAWQPYSPTKLDQLIAEKKTVMIDFTADWCATCQLNSTRALNTKRVEQVVRANGVVPLLADLSNPSREIDQLLDDLHHSSSIPVLAVFPADHPHEPIVLFDLVSQSDVLEMLQEAGPSRTGLAAADPTTH